MQVNDFADVRYDPHRPSFRCTQIVNIESPGRCERTEQMEEFISV